MSLSKNCKIFQNSNNSIDSNFKMDSPIGTSISTIALISIAKNVFPNLNLAISPKDGETFMYFGGSFKRFGKFR